MERKSNASTVLSLIKLIIINNTYTVHQLRVLWTIVDD